MIFYFNFNNNIIIFKPIIWFSVINFSLSTIFSLGKIFYYFLLLTFLHKSVCLCDYIFFFFFKFMAFGNLQHSVISRVSFSIIKIPSLSLKNALYFFFFFCNVFYFFTTTFFNSP